MAGSRTDVASLAKEIVAVMDSTPDGLSAHQIESDYRSLVGKSLRERVKTLGYRDVDSFLLSLAQERTIEMENTSYGHRFRAGDAAKSTAHIRALVKNQVSKGKKCGKTRNSMKTSTAPAKRKELPKAMMSNIVKMVRKKKGEFPLCNLIKMYHDEYGATFNFRLYGFSCLKEAVSSVEDLLVTVRGDVASVSYSPVAPSTSSPSTDSAKKNMRQAITKVLGVKEVPLYKFNELYRATFGREFDPKQYGYSSTLNLMNDLVDTVNLRRENHNGDWFLSHVKYSSNKGSVQQTQEVEIPKKKRIPHDVAKKIFTVVEEMSGGVYLGNFREVFKLETGTDLSPPSYGFSSIQSLLSELLGTKMEIVSAKFGPLIRVKTSAEVAEHAQLTPRGSLSSDIQDAVGPGVCYNNPSTTPPLNQYITLLVSQIYDPSDFYVQLMPDAHAGKRLEELMDQLEEVYSPLEDSQKYRLPLAFVVPGQLVVCRYPNDNHWHRARITKVIDDNFVQVIFVDYGTRCSVHKSQLFYLKQKFLITPVYAQRATLFGISPATGETWSHVACKAFLNLTASKQLCAIVKAIDRDQKLSICLTDTTGNIDIHINDYLVTSEFATFADLSAQVPHQMSGELDWSVSSDSDSDTSDTLLAEGPPNTVSPHISINSVSSNSTPSLSTIPAEQATGEIMASTPLPNSSASTSLTVTPTQSQPLTVSIGSVSENHLTSTSTLTSPSLASIVSAPPTVSMATTLSKVFTATAAATVSMATAATMVSTAISSPFVSSITSQHTSVPSVSIAAPPPLVSTTVAHQMLSTTQLPHQEIQNQFGLHKTQKTATVKPQRTFQAQPRFPVPPSNLPYNQGMSFMLPPPLIQPGQVPGYRGYVHSATPYSEAPMYYPVLDRYPIRQHVYPPRQLIPENFSHPHAAVPSSHSTSEHNSGRFLGQPVIQPNANMAASSRTTVAGENGDGPPPLQHVGCRSQSVENSVTTEIPALVSVSSISKENPLSDAITNKTGSHRPPPLEHVNLCKSSINEDSGGKEPPPLVPVTVLSPTGSCILKQADEVSTAHNSLNSVQQLKFKLTGLQLRRKRMQREQLDPQQVDCSGDGDTGLNLAGIEKEIDECMKQLFEIEGQNRDWSLKSFGRGRGRLNLASLVD